MVAAEKNVKKTDVHSLIYLSCSLVVVDAVVHLVQLSLNSRPLLHISVNSLCSIDFSSIRL